MLALRQTGLLGEEIAAKMRRAKSTVSKVKGVVSDSVQPTLENVRETTENVRGTVAFVSDYAVTPVVRSYGIIAGARRFMVVVSRFRRRSEE